MKIRTMTATFGKLDRAELRLDDGLNIMYLPNEGGKSTWAAFILAMFYGIDTSERAAKGTLPAKTRFKPWNGSAMEGRIELSWNGREITIERHSKGRIPMGEFRAYDTKSGLPISELTAENCGLKLLGVERAVFERSAFLRQTGLKIDQTGALEQRLGALVTSGDETVSYSDTEKRLRDWKNSVRHNRTGELPRLERELEDIDETLYQIHANQSGSLALRAREEERNAVLTKLQRIERGIKAAEYRNQREMLKQADTLRDEKQSKAKRLNEETAALPRETVLHQWQQEWMDLQKERRCLPVAAVQEPHNPVISPVFAGKTEKEIEKQVQDDLHAYDTYEKASEPIRIPAPWLAVLFAAAAVILMVCSLWVIGIGSALASCVLFGVYVRKKRADERERNNASLAAREILKTYGAQDRDGICAMAEEATETLARWEQERQAAAQMRKHQKDMAEALQQKENSYLEKLRQVLPLFDGEPISALHGALLMHRERIQAEREADEAAKSYDRLSATIPAAEEEFCDAEIVTGYDEAEIRRQLRIVQRELQEIRSALDRAQGQISALGDPAELEARREQLRSEIAEKQMQYDALTTAMDALAKANGLLQTQFAPEISRKAAEIMGRLTNGRYDKVLLDQQLSITAREAGEVVSRDLITLSQGTGDQLYLAVRLAICNSVLPEHALLVLDDTLVNFDDERAAAALAVLREEGKQRQIVLFTCHKREIEQ